MPRYVAFLRAINVGGRTVKMDRLREIFESLGLGDVETFIASGNVIFRSRSTKPQALEKKIERSLRQSAATVTSHTTWRAPAEKRCCIIRVIQRAATRMIVAFKSSTSVNVLDPASVA